MPECAFVITIDTEGDDLWSQPREITTGNAACLPRFQALCERYGFKPVYLTDHEMALSDTFVEFARDALARGTAEIGMHLHAWNSPPIEALSDDDFRYQPYLIEYKTQAMKEKIAAMTGLLEETFDRKMVSHRAGRWAFDSRYAGLLAEAGYLVDCSVTPGIDWRRNPGLPGGKGGSDYRAFPDHPYFFDASDIARPSANGGMLEAPMTIRPSGLYRKASWAYGIPLVRRAANTLRPALSWLSPVQPSLRAAPQRHLDAMLNLEGALRREGSEYVQLMMHSSELMPGGNPVFRDAIAIDRMFAALEMLFDELSQWCRGVTLKEFHAQCVQDARAGMPAAAKLGAAVAQ